jgi:hypothetical protein
MTNQRLAGEITILKNGMIFKYHDSKVSDIRMDDKIERVESEKGVDGQVNTKTPVNPA